MALAKKKGIQASLNYDYYFKLKFLQQKLKRNNESDIVRYIIERFIDDYEEINGEIKID